MPNVVHQTVEFRDWLKGLSDHSAQDALTARIVRMQSGLMGDAKALGGKVAEARIDVGPGYRLYFTKRGLEIVLLLCGGDKSTQSSDIARARNMVKELDGQEKAARPAGKGRKR